MSRRLIQRRRRVAEAAERRTQRGEVDAANDASVSEKLIAANAVIGFAPTRTFVKRAQWAIDYTPITRDENSLEAEKKTISLARVNHE